MANLDHLQVNVEGVESPVVCNLTFRMLTCVCSFVGLDILVLFLILSSKSICVIFAFKNHFQYKKL